MDLSRSGTCAMDNRQRAPFPRTPMQPYIQPTIALIAGILILVRPKLLNYVVAIYLIIVGAMGLARLS
jgi:hypothetical protein